MKYQGFCGGAYLLGSVNMNAQQSINLFPEVDETGVGKSKIALRGTPGLALFATAPKSPIRALWAGDKRCFTVAGDTLYEVSSAGAFTSFGTVGDDATHTPAQIFANGNQIMCVSAGNVYVSNGGTVVQPAFPASVGTALVMLSSIVMWATGDTFDGSMVGRSITISGTPYTVSFVFNETTLQVAGAPANGGPFAFSVAGKNVTATQGAFLDGYFIAQVPNSKQINISAINDGISYTNSAGVRVYGWDPLDYAIKEAYPDNIAAIIADHEELYLFGTETTEVWRNTGNADFPFERDPGAFIHIGCKAPWAVNRLAQGLCFIGGDERGAAVAYRLQGFVPVRISNHAIEQEWRYYTDIKDAIGYTYEEGGHQFWCIGFPTSNRTWVYDHTLQMWHQRSSIGFANRHRSRCHAYIFDKHLVGDHTNGKIYVMSTLINDEEGAPIQWLRSAPHIAEEEGWFFHSKFTLDMETGLGGADPTVLMKYSDDGGHTWSNDHVGTAGASLAYKTRVVWRRLSRSRDRVYQVRSETMTTRVMIIDAYLEIAKGTN